jgi:hypothetical protein
LIYLQWWRWWRWWQWLMPTLASWSHQWRFLVIWGGVIWGGDIWAGVIWGGDIWAGVLWGLLMTVGE